MGDVKAGDMMRTITLNVRVRGLRTMRGRLWLGLRLIWLGVWVTGMDCHIETEVDDDASTARGRR